MATAYVSPPPWVSLEAGLDRRARSIIRFLDLAFTGDGMSTVLAAIKDRSPEAPFGYIVTPNVDHIVRLERSRSDLLPAYRAAWLTLCDSKVLARLALKEGHSLPVVPGSDLTARVFEELVQPGDRIAIVGGGRDIVRKLASWCRGGEVLHHEPPMGFIRNELEVARAVDFVTKASARYTFLCIGSPQQEILAHKIFQTGRTTGIGFCVGASLRFLTGQESRAPLLMRRMSLEWLHRLSSNPRRMWRRYLVDGPEIFRIARDWRRSHATG